MRKYFSIIIISFFLLTNVSFADSTVDRYLKDLEYIDSNLSIIIYNLAQNKYDDISSFEKDMEFIESLLNSINISVDNDYKNSKNKNLIEQSFYLAADNISNYYEMSAINIRLYMKSKDKDKFFNIINSYNSGHTDLITLKDKMSKVK